MTDIKITPSPYGTWEYIPAGGMALTAEQVEDVKIVLGQLERGGPAFEAAHERLRALFPATEPAEERCQSVSIFRERCALVPGHDGRHAANGCAWGYPPAPAEPAEEETKAEGPCTGGGDMHPCVLPAGHAGVHADSRGLRWQNPASSPVVPAPTETGPWQTCGHVPIGIVFRSKDRHPAFTWVNEGGSLLSVRNECEDGHFSDGEHCLPSMVDENFAPFVAAEEG